MDLLAARQREEDHIGCLRDGLGTRCGLSADGDHGGQGIRIHVKHMHRRGLLADEIGAHAAAHHAQSYKANGANETENGGGFVHQ
jgi:hypothetical protein